MSEWQYSSDQVVITGIAGRFPGSDNVAELKANLLANKDCVTSKHERWNKVSKYIPNRIGQIGDISKFDNVFFGVHLRSAESMDPMIRMMMEICYEAIADAGVNPADLKDSNTAVLTGSSFSETEKLIFYEKNEKNGFGLTGCSRAMLANRISFSLGLTGPSLNIDAACAGSGASLVEAYHLIKTGVCDAAIVGGVNLVIHPHLSFSMLQLGLLSPSGINRSFDWKADGSTRSETVVAFFLQRGNAARRVYTEMIAGRMMHVPSVMINNCMYPTAEYQARVMQQTLDEAGLAPTDVTYVEADGSGINFADAEEAKAIDQVYNKGRRSPLLIGSVKSNIGHAAGANTLNSALKVIFAMEKEIIPANLHFEKPPENVEPLAKGRLKVVTENTPWNGQYAAISTTSFSGDFVHIILKAFNKRKKNNGKPEDELSRLVTLAGRTAESLASIVNYLKTQQCDTEFVNLLHNVFEKQSSKHLFRSYFLLPPMGLSNSSYDLEEVSTTKREIWYVFSGMGSQWIGMGKSLMKLPIFAASVYKCDAVLRPHGIDIIRILTDNDPTIFDNITHAFVGIATMQVALVDVLKQIGLEPDMIIGHSVGELGCAYADGCFTAEEMILSALSRGLASIETELIRGSMAAIGLGYHEIAPLCPPDIDVACHNGPESATISGPEESINKFVAELQAKGIFAKKVACGNIAYHSRYISPAGPKLIQRLQNVVPNPKLRSKRWISSSLPRSEWNTPKGRLSSAEYHTNNLLNPVLFAEACRLIPKNAITIEIAPHGLLQAILRRSLHSKCINVALTKKDHIDSTDYLFQSLGKLHNAGLQIYPSRLYDKPNYPVAKCTNHISPLIKWNHIHDRYVNFFVDKVPIVEGEKIFKINLEEDAYAFLKSHKINEEVVIPCSWYLTLAWDIWKNFREIPWQETKFIIFEDVRIHKPVLIIPEDETISLTVMVQKGSGRFEITCNYILIMTGYIRQTDDEKVLAEEKLNSNIKNPLTENDIYTEFLMRGYSYEEPFRNITQASLDCCEGTITWKNNWTTFLDGLLQFYNLGQNIRDIQVPLVIRKISINVKKHKLSIANSKDTFPILVNKNMQVVNCDVVHIEGIKLTMVEIKSTKEIYSLATSIPGSGIKTQCTTMMATQLVQGDPNSITWINGPTTYKEQNFAKVEYAALNHHDILNAQKISFSDQLECHADYNRTFGLEYSGTDSRNATVMGICGNGTLTNYVKMDPHLTWPVPIIWTREEAATIPLSYAVAYKALFLTAELNKFEKILVEGGAGEFGQAIINVALKENCVIYTSYDTEEEKKLIQCKYPEIEEHRIFDIKNSFIEKIKMDNDGEGVDVIVIGSDKINKIETFLECTTTGSRVLIVGNIESAIHDSFGIFIFLQELSLFSIIPKKIATADADVKQVLAALIKNGIESGVVKPLSRNVYESESLKKAFLDGIAKKNHPKILIRIPDVKSIASDNLQFRKQCDPSKSYLVIEGFGDFGVKVIDWLISRGAKQVVVASEGKNQRRYWDLRISFWQNHGATVIVHENMNLTTKHTIKRLLQETNELGTIEGIFDLSNKIIVTKLLDQESKMMNGNVENFVACVPMANDDECCQSTAVKEKELEALMEARLNNGLSGVAAVCSAFNNDIYVKCLQLFDQVLASNSPVVTITREEIFRHNKTLKRKQDTSNRAADTQDSVAAKFKAGLYQKDRYITDRFGTSFF